MNDDRYNKLWPYSGMTAFLLMEDVLDAILRAKPEYERRYQRAMRISAQVQMYGSNEFLPGAALHQEVQRYTGNPAYTHLGSAVPEQILMDQLGRIDLGGSLEDPPDRLTIGRFSELFAHCVYRGLIDLAWPRDRQASALLESMAPYIGLVRAGRFESMLKREDGERLIARELYLQLRHTASQRSDKEAKT
jgi:hypothetical protein